MHKKLIILLLTVILAFSLAACGTAAAQQEDLTQRPILVVATTGMIADAISNVGGDRVSVTGLMGPGVDPHLYKARESDLRALEDADIIFYNGLHLEAGLANVLERMADRRATVAVAEAVDPEQRITPPEFAGAYDPHIWFDVTLWKLAVAEVRDGLTELDPDSADLYSQNAQNYLSELDALDAYVRQQVERVPADKRALITAHDAFNYFGRAYGFEVRGLQGISTASEAGTADVQALAEFIAERQIPAIFVESSVPQRNIEAVQAAVRAKGFEVQIGGQLYSDALGSPDSSAATYVGMVRANVDTLVSALLAD